MRVYDLTVSGSLVVSGSMTASGDISYDDLTATGNIESTGTNKVISGSSTSTGSFAHLKAVELDSNIGTLVSGSLGTNASLIRTLTAAGVSGSITDASSSYSTRVTLLEGSGSITESSASFSTRVALLEGSGSITESSASFSTRVALLEGSGSITESSSSFSTRTTTLENANISGGFVAQSVLSGSGTVFSGSSLSTGSFAHLKAVELGSTIGTLISGSITDASSSYSTRVTLLEGSGSITESSASFSTRVATLETSGSITESSASFSTRVATLETSGSITESSASFSTRVTRNEATGSSLTTDSGSFSTRVALLEGSGSITESSASFSTRVATLETSGSITESSASFSTRVALLEGSGSITESSASFSTRVSNLKTDSGSFSTRVSNLKTDSGSFSTRTNTLEVTSSIVAGTGTVQGVGTSNSPTFGGLTVAGTIVSQEIHTEFVSASVTVATGSNTFGDNITDTHSVTGSLRVSGSDFSVNSAGTVSSSVNSTGSFGSLVVGGTGENSFTGNVGIGTTNPSQPLHIRASSPRLSIDRTSTSGNVDLSFRTNDAETDGCWTIRMGSDTTPDLSFNRWTDGSADTAIMTLNHDGSSTFAGNVSGSSSSTGSFGMVGVGTANPETKLQVGGANQGGVGTAFMARGDSGDIARIWSGATGGNRALMVGHLQNGGTSQAVFNVKRGNASNDAFYEEMFVVKTDLSYFLNGNVGIGTTSPASKFTIYHSEPYLASANTDGHIKLIGANGPSTGSGIRFSSAAGNYENFFGVISGSGDQGDFVFQGFNGSSYAEWMRVKASGYVGIGTTGPTVQLEVYGSADQQIRIDSTGNRAQLQFDGTKTTNAEFAEINFANAGDSVAAIHAFRQGANDQASLQFMTQATGGSVATRMTISGSGKVGIGTTAPAGALHITDGDGAVSTGVIISNERNINNNNYIKFRKSRQASGTDQTIVTSGDYLGQIDFAGCDATNEYETGASIRAITEGTIGSNQMPTNLSFHTENTSAAFAERMRISADGNVGIGTTSPVGRLDIAQGGYTAGTQALHIGADSGDNTSRSNSTTKYGVITFPHYNTSEEHIEMFSFYSNNTDNNLGIGGNGNSAYNSLSTISFRVGATDTTTSNSATTKMHISSDGVGIGTTSPGAVLHVTASSASTPGVYFSRSNETDNNTEALKVENRGTKGIGLHVYSNAASAANALVQIHADNSGFDMPALRVVQDGSGDAAWFTGGNVGIGTTAPAEKLTIESGSIFLRTQGEGIGFGDNNDANTLDDYEEGYHTWAITGTPSTITGEPASSGSWTPRGSYTQLAYTKIGRVVHVQGKFETAGHSGTRDGAICISMPFTADASLTDNAEYTCGSVTFNRCGSSAIATQITPVIWGNGNFCQFQMANESGGSETYLQATDVDTHVEGQINITYIAE